jgi:hypothetical protein
MNRLYDHKALTYRNTLKRLRDYADKVNLIPALADATTQLDGMLTALDQHVHDFENIATGKSRAKINAEKSLLDVLFIAVTRLAAFARKINDSALIELSAYNKSDMWTMRDGVFQRYAQDVCDAITANADQLANYGQKPEHVTNLQNAINDFTKNMSESDAGHVDKAGSYKSLRQDIKQIDALLNETIDPLVLTLQDEEPAFCTAYFDTRVVHDRGVRHNKPVPTPAPLPAPTPIPAPVEGAIGKD